MARILEENQYNTTEETCPSQFTVPANSQGDLYPREVSVMHLNDLCRINIANSVDPDQTAPTSRSHTVSFLSF